MSDAWDAARKIICDGGNNLKSEQIIEIFGCVYFYEIFDKYSASEVIAKIKEYEEKQRYAAHWIKMPETKHVALCSVCGHPCVWDFRTKICECCGAEMQEVDGD